MSMEIKHAANDLIRLAMERAVERFGPGRTRNLFTACGLSQAIVGLAGTKDQIDGRIIRAILAGRADVRVLSGGALSADRRRRVAPRRTHRHTHRLH